MNEQIMQTAVTRITTDLRAQLLRVVEHCRRVPHYGAIFDKPVDYVGIPLPDYLAIVKRPMDFQMLKRNLLAGEYEFLYEFLHDADLIWTNCRAYNQDNQVFSEISNYIEETFLIQLDKMELRVTPEIYKIIISTNIPKMKPQTRIFSVTRLQCLMKELCDLPESVISECVYKLLDERNELNMIHGHDVTLRLQNCSYEVLEKFERMVFEQKVIWKDRQPEARPKEEEPKRRHRKRTGSSSDE